MQRSISISSLLILAFFGWFGTSCTDVGICRRGSGPIQSDTLSFSAFTGVELAEMATVTLTQGNTQSVVFTGNENVIESLDSRVENGHLVIELDGCFTTYDLEVAITLPSSQALTALVVSGAGSIQSQGSLVSASDLDLVVSGAGNITLSTEAQAVTSTISGAGDINLIGQATAHKATISGSGDLASFDFPVDTADITISGTGRADVTVSQDLTVEISGAGSVFYKGNPTINQTISGTGKVVDAN